ncbi:MAG: porin PorA family protein [Frankia sp.]
MRQFARALVVLGLLLVVLAGAFKLAGPDLLVKYPSTVDKTFEQTGDTTLYVLLRSVTPLSKTLSVPLSVKVRLHTIGHAGNAIVVAEDQQQDINKGAIKTDRKLNFVFDRSSMKNVANIRAFAFDPTKGLDRSPNYAINFPIHTGSGPYAVWKDETGTTFPMSKVGETSENGVKLTTMRGTMSGVPLADSYVKTLPSIIFVKQEPLSKLSTALVASHIDPVAVTRSVKTLLTPGDNAAIQRILAQQVHLSFTLTASTTMQVEPTTGVITGLSVDETISAVPDVAQITMIQSILNQPRYADRRLVGSAEGLMARLAANPPSTKILRYRYSSTPAALADLTRYANHLRKQIREVETTIPIVLLVLGLVLCAVGLVVRIVFGSGRTTPPAPKHRHGPRPAPTGPGVPPDQARPRRASSHAGSRIGSGASSRAGSRTGSHAGSRTGSGFVATGNRPAGPSPAPPDPGTILGGQSGAPADSSPAAPIPPRISFTAGDGYRPVR